jgi:anthranilate phosphoribosyltransferase
VIGVSDPAYLEIIAGALALLGVDRALVVSSEDGLDEMSTSAATQVVEVNGDVIQRSTLSPEDVGIQRSADPPAGGTPQENAATVRAVLAGEPGSARDIALLNAGAAIYAADRAPSLREGVDAARAAVDDGAAARALERYVALSLELAP